MQKTPSGRGWKCISPPLEEGGRERERLTLVVPEGWTCTCSDSTDASQRPTPLSPFIYSLSKLPLLHLFFFLLLLSVRFISILTVSLLPFCHPSSFASLPYSASSSLPLIFISSYLCHIQKHFRSLVLLPLSWHRQQGDTWEGCFVIQQVIPPWHRQGGGGCWWDKGTREGGRSEQSYITTFQPIPFLHPSVCMLMVSSFFFPPTMGGLASLHSLYVEAFGVNRERRTVTGRKQGKGENGDGRECVN